MENVRREIRKQSETHRKTQTLMHHVNKANLMTMHNEQKPNKATGIDNINKEKYEMQIDENLNVLLIKMKKFQYRPKAVKRVYIPKDNGGTRPLGIPAYEDRLVQGVMAIVLEEVYEPRFMDTSYGFRPNRNCHQAIKKINQTIMNRKINYVLDADIKGFFDNVDHKWLIQFLEHDIQDKNFIRYIVRFLKSGIMEELTAIESDKGTPQGGLISPTLANVYLHYVLDVWFEKRMRRVMRGDVELVRYADDFVIMFEYEDDAKELYRQLKERLAKFNLELAEEKTRIIPFGRNVGTKETFDFLGFRHINGKTLKGKYRVHHRNSISKMKQKRQTAKQWIRKHQHEPIDWIMKSLKAKLRGHYSYYGISGNYTSIQKFNLYIKDTCYKTLNKRHQKKSMSWAIFERIWKGYEMPQPKIYVNIWT